MNEYKKYIKSPTVRVKILNALRFVPDSLMLKIQYRIKLKRKLNLKNPKRFTEKIQYYKMSYRNSLMHMCVDKYNVRKFVESKGLENILIPLITKADSIQDVDWNSLPSQFVIKTTHGGGGIDVIICKNKENFNITKAEQKLKSSNKPFKARSGGREWAYYGLSSGVVVENLLLNSANPEAGINDYKFFCFNGVPKYVVVDTDRYIGHKRNFYDLEWNNLNIESDCPSCDKKIEKPKNFDYMIKVAKRLSESFPFVRVDLYNINGKIYFGELTFYPWSGYVQFFPDKFDYILGKDFDINKI